MKHGRLLCPRPLGGGIKRWCASVVCLTTFVHGLSHTSGRPAGRMCGWDGAYWLIGPGSAGLAQGCRCALPLQGRGTLWWPPAQLVITDNAGNNATDRVLFLSVCEEVTQKVLGRILMELPDSMSLRHKIIKLWAAARAHEKGSQGPVA